MWSIGATGGARTSCWKTLTLRKAVSPSINREHDAHSPLPETRCSWLLALVGLGGNFFHGEGHGSGRGESEETPDVALGVVLYLRFCKSI